MHLKELEKDKQTKPELSRNKETVKIRAKNKWIETRKTIEEINELKLFLWKLNKIDKLLPSLIKWKREKVQTNKIKNKEGNVIIDTTEIQRIV